MDLASAEGIAGLLGDGFNVYVVESAVSTNLSLKEMAALGAPHGSVFVARSQTGGRGRLGRSFCSKPGGLYISLLLRPQISLASASLLTPAAAVAAALTVEEELGIRLGIKWVNDLFYRGKKVCGILTEASAAPGGDALDYAIVGLGLNIYEPQGGFGDGLDEVAASLLPSDKGRDGTMDRLAARIAKRIFDCTESLESDELYKAYRERLILFGKEVEVRRGNEKYRATVKDLNRDYTLSVEDENGGLHRLFSGEVSIKSESFS